MINIGSNQEKTILDYCKFILKKVDANLKVKFDKKKPNGTPRKILNCKLAHSYGWKSKFSLEKGFEITYQNFIKSRKKII